MQDTPTVEKQAIQYDKSKRKQNGTFPKKYTLEQWDNAREDYVSGRGDLVEIGIKHGITRSTLHSRAAAGFWAAERDERRRQKRILSKNGHVLPSPSSGLTTSLASLQESAARYYVQADITEIHLARLNQAILDEQNADTITSLLKSRSIALDQWKSILGLNPARTGKREKSNGFRHNHESHESQDNQLVEAKVHELEATSLAPTTPNGALLSPEPDIMPYPGSDA